MIEWASENLAYIHFSTILQRERQAQEAPTDQLETNFEHCTQYTMEQWSGILGIQCTVAYRLADCHCTNTMSATSAKPVKVAYELASCKMKGALAFKLELRNIWLQQDIYLGCWLVYTFLDRNWYALE